MEILSDLESYIEDLFSSMMDELQDKEPIEENDDYEEDDIGSCPTIEIGADSPLLKSLLEKSKKK